MSLLKLILYTQGEKMMRNFFRLNSSFDPPVQNMANIKKKKYLSLVK